MEDSKRASRRRHPADLKARVLAACGEAGASVAQIALTHGLNANLVHKWRRRADRRTASEAPLRETGGFIPLAIAPTPTPVAADIRIELRRGPIAVNVMWPVASASDCALWLREVLK